MQIDDKQRGSHGMVNVVQSQMKTDDRASPVAREPRQEVSISRELSGSPFSMRRY